MDLVTNVVSGSNADRLLLLLHGYGADERDLGGLLGYLDPEGKFATVLPRGPRRRAARVLVVRHGRADPDDIAGGFADGARPRSTTSSTPRAPSTASTRAEAVVGGFSQGGGLALALGLGPQRPRPPRRCAGHEPVRAAGPVRRRLRGVRRDVPVLLQHGTDDPMIPVSRHPRAWPRSLVEAGLPVVFGEYPMGHEVALESVQQAQRLARRGARRRAARRSRCPEPAARGPVKSVTTADVPDRGARRPTCP